jgi:RHS repeat-associated protein
VVNSYSYLPFGEIVRATGTTPNPFIYVGQFGVMSDSSGEDFMRNRYYDWSQGRFTQVDPQNFAGGAINFYQYAGNSATDTIDPVGLCAIDLGGTLSLLFAKTYGIQFNAQGAWWYRGTGVASPGIGGGPSIVSGTLTSGLSKQIQGSVGDVVSLTGSVSFPATIVPTPDRPFLPYRVDDDFSHPDASLGVAVGGLSSPKGSSPPLPVGVGVFLVETKPLSGHFAGFGRFLTGLGSRLSRIPGLGCLDNNQANPLEPEGLDPQFLGLKGKLFPLPVLIEDL